MIVAYAHCLMTLSLTINETLKWLSLLPILMHSDGDSAAIHIYNLTLLPTPPPPPLLRTHSPPPPSPRPS